MRVHHQHSGAGAWRAPVAEFAVLLFALLPLCADVARAREQFTRLKSDEQIIFFPAVGRRVAGQEAWRIEIRGCVFEPEKRRILLAALRESLELNHVKMTAAEQTIFNERARLFLVDHERGKPVFVRAGGTVSEIGKSQADGNFGGEIVLSDGQVTRLRETDASGTWHIQFAARLPPDDRREFAGDAMLLADTGVSVISDIDDTIKVTQVTSRRATLQNTFLRPFEPVPQTAVFYQTLARSNQAAFHYVSASPWQLYAPLSEFIRANGFPPGAFALREFRWKNQSFLSLFADPEKHKRASIEPLLERFPQRRFVFIGDSGERDPEIYAALARKYPRQVERIYIRDVTGEAADARRYEGAFEGLPRGFWQVFREPGELLLARPPD
jgi:phosphatidate phosphatase APP1